MSRVSEILRQKVAHEDAMTELAVVRRDLAQLRGTIANIERDVAALQAAIEVAASYRDGLSSGLMPVHIPIVVPIPAGSGD